MTSIPALHADAGRWAVRVPGLALFLATFVVAVVALVDAVARPDRLDSLGTWTSWGTIGPLAVGLASLVVAGLGWWAPRPAARATVLLWLVCIGAAGPLTQMLVAMLAVMVVVDLVLLVRQRRVARAWDAPRQPVRRVPRRLWWPWAAGAAAALVVGLVPLSVGLDSRADLRDALDHSVDVGAAITGVDPDTGEIELETTEYYYWIAAWDTGRYRPGQEVRLLVDGRTDDPLAIVGDVDPTAGGVLTLAGTGLLGGLALALAGAAVVTALRGRRLERRGGPAVHVRATVLPRAGRVVLRTVPGPEGPSRRLGVVRGVRVVVGARAWLPYEGAWDVPATVVGLRDDTCPVHVALAVPQGVVVLTSDRDLDAATPLDLGRLESVHRSPA